MAIRPYILAATKFESLRISSKKYASLVGVWSPNPDMLLGRGKQDLSPNPSPAIRGEFLPLPSQGRESGG